jgi:hypothetical protein
MNRKQLDGTWQGWLQENLARKCDPKQLLGILLRDGFSGQSIWDKRTIFRRTWAK